MPAISCRRWLVLSAECAIFKKFSERFFKIIRAAAYRSYFKKLIKKKITVFCCVFGDNE
jgi:hypothetical protein